MSARARRPRALRPGDTVAVLSPSWGGPAVFPWVYEAGLATLRGWGLEVREYPSTRAGRDDAARSPEGRAADVNAAFADPGVAAVIASIGGDDAIRLLPYLDAATIAANPRILLGYSDTTVLLAAVRRMGLVTFHGPSVMAGLAQLGSLPADAAAHVRRMLFEPADGLRYPRWSSWVDGYRPWSEPANAAAVAELRHDDGPHVLQGAAAGRVRGELFGGCVEVLDWLRGSPTWPVGAEGAGWLLFLEPSEEKPSVEAWVRMLRAMAAAGAFTGIAGLLVGRARDHTADEKRDLEAAIAAFVSEELGRADLPVVANLPFGHTDPQWVLPLGVEAELDCATGDLALVEPWLD
ncbi:MAG: S66 peptidase family protein [Chloroflexota bacterium]